MLAEGLAASGILAILIQGIIMRNYCFLSLSPVSSITIDYLVQMAGKISENFVFAYMGISVPIMIDNVKISLIFCGIIALLISRFFSVLIVAILLNVCTKKKIPFTYVLIMTQGGLRGAVAFYLAL